MASIATTSTTSVLTQRLASTDWALLVLRVALGSVFVLHGGQKAFGWFGGPGLEGATQFMGQMGIPAPMAYVAIFTELFGGAALILGVLSRLASAGLIVTMLVAIAKVHFANGFFIGGKEGPGFEFNFALIAMSLAVLIAGPGRLAIGDWERKLFGQSRSA